MNTVVPTRVPFPCPFRQVASMRNHNARKIALLCSTRHVRVRITDRRSKHTNNRTGGLPVVSQRSSLVSSRFLRATNVAAQLVLKCTNARSHNPLDARQLAPKPVDVFGPTALRVRLRVTSLYRPSRRRRGFVVCACRLRPPLR